MSRLTGRLRGEGGFTLVELLVALLVMSLVMGGTLTAVMAAVRGERYAHEFAEQIDGMRVAMDRLRKEVRSTRAVRLGSDDDTLILWLDRDQDQVPDTGEVVTYELVDVGGGLAELRRWTQAQGPAAAMVVARNLEPGTPFSYDAPPQDTKVVTITFQGASDWDLAPENLSVTTAVRVRNV